MISDTSIKYAEQAGKLKGTMQWVALYENISDEAFKKLARCIIDICEEGNPLDEQSINWMNEAAQKRGIIL